MRWSAAALLVPLFLLPLVALGVLAAWARSVHHDALDRVQAGGAIAWLNKTPELAAAARAAFDKTDGAGPHAIPITIDGRVYLVEPSAGLGGRAQGDPGANRGRLRAVIPQRFVSTILFGIGWPPRRAARSDRRRRRRLSNYARGSTASACAPHRCPRARSCTSHAAGAGPTCCPS